ncbi:MAG: phosphoglucomutase [Candidatus Marinimicrobia bacterium]|nr:phosphoglucomutase [Candidatus Neomarinimicrobiota bacterium]
MKNNPIHFGTDGWRGFLDSEMNKNSVSLVAQAFADYLSSKISKESPSCVIGYDTRRYSKVFAELFAEILSGNGIDTFLSDRVVPTPVVSFTVKERGLHAGVMITASHNPPTYNGVKFKGPYGGPFLTEETLKVEKNLGKSPIKRSKINVKQVNLLPDYMARLEELIDFSLIQEAGISCAVDSMHGAGGTLLTTLLNTHKCKVYGIAETYKEDFGGRLAEPIEKNLGPLQDFLSNHRDVSLGVATDGDADRLGVMMNNGIWLSAQDTILYLTDYLVCTKKIPGALVKTASVTDKLRLFERDYDRLLFEVQVGFKYITEKMLELPVAFGAEESGGFGYGIHMPERDGIFSALLFLEMIAASGFTFLSDYMIYSQKKYGKIYYDRIDSLCDVPNRLDVLPALYKTHVTKIGPYVVKNIQPYISSQAIINGIKFRLDGTCRWLLLRASDTEPLMRVYAEGESDDEVTLLLQKGVNLIYTYAGVHS